jgi:RNA recognition motif-containing protein
MNLPYRLYASVYIPQIIWEGNNMRIYMGNLSYDVTEDELKQKFAEFAEVTSVSIPVDRDSGRPRGYGFLDMPKQEQAEAAILALHAKQFKDRALTVNEARPRSEVGAGGYNQDGHQGGGGGKGRGGGAGGTRGRSY